MYYGNENDLFLCITVMTLRIFCNIMVTRTYQENLRFFFIIIMVMTVNIFASQ